MPDTYSEIVLDHFSNPRNVGVLLDSDGDARVENPVNGATLELYLNIAEGRINQSAFKSLGCTATIAAGSMVTELINGQTVQDAGAITRFDIEAALGGLPPTRKHAASLAEDAIRAAIANYQARVVG
jgi:nitrogen fixation NifU-like protein